MADDNLFGALAFQIMAGGGVIDQIGQHARRLAQNYASATRFNPSDPPWGRGDELADAFERKYVKPHAELLDALETLAGALTAAGTMTVNAGKSFQGAQDSALTSIHASAGGGYS